MNRNEALYEIKKFLPENPITCEIGFFKGEYSKIINEILKPKIHYVIDTFSDVNHISGDKDGENLSSQNMTEMEEYSRSLGYITVKGDSGTLNECDRLFNFIYIDADHSYEWVERDLANSWHYADLYNNCVIAGHDYSESRFPGCYRAVNEFCEKHDLKISLITDDGCPSFFIAIGKNNEKNISFWV